MIRLALALCLFLPAIASAQEIKVDTDRQKAQEQMARTAAGVGLGVIVCISGVGFLLTLIPIGLALVRGHPDTVAIALVSLIFGWTCIGWFIALIWAVKSFPRTASGDARDY